LRLQRTVCHEDSGSFPSKSSALYVVNPKGSDVMGQADSHRSSGRCLSQASPCGNRTGRIVLCGCWLPAVSIITTML